ncbi:hypothetical protein T492DRAFT_858287 [Pavlovales sp. CCMP2436]|nr:hypothetical protein T492DRAFT_858287 [Pavlovales sp. CCMP2436]
MFGVSRAKPRLTSAAGVVGVARDARSGVLQMSSIARRRLASSAGVTSAVGATSARLASMPKSNVFAACTKMAGDYGAVNLGQGFPSWPVPQFVLDAAKASVLDDAGYNQYSRPGGHPLLLDSIARFSSRRMHRQIGPENVTVSAGAQGEHHC